VLMHPPLRNIVSAATPGYVDRNRGHTPPMGLLYIQAAVEHSKHESVFLDADLEGWNHEETARQALSHKPDLVGLQAMTFTLPDAYLVAKAIKSLSPEVKVMIGGPHPTVYPGETAGLDAVDFALAGEGEKTFVSFLDNFFEPCSAVTTPGLACKTDGAISYTPSLGFSDDLDSIPIPARHSSPYKRYTSVLAERNPITIMITSRGCPFDCIFCNRMGRKYRCHSAEYVLREIEDILSLGIKEIFVHDDTFTIRKNRVEAICQGIIHRDYDVIWEARTRVDCVDEELLALMRKAGCHRLSFGVESGSEKVLKSMRKKIDLDRVRQVFSWCKREGITTLADFMFGNLDEEEDDVKMTMKLVEDIDPDYAQFSLCSPYPATPLYEIALERGVVPYDIWQEFAQNPLMDIESPVWTERFSVEELRKVTAAAYRRFYFRPAFMMKQLLKANSFNQVKTMMSGAIGMLRNR
jgi:anaerobic magnesium-protoporphyrin IX monomethyl ester cyclase